MFAPYMNFLDDWGIRPASRQEPIIQGSVALMRSLKFTLREKWTTRGFKRRSKQFDFKS